MAVEESHKLERSGRFSLELESDTLPTFDPDGTRTRDSAVRPPKLFAPTPTPTPYMIVSTPQSKRDGQDEREKRPESRSQRIRHEPVRMPIPRLHSASSTTSLQDSNGATIQPQKRPPGPLLLKKAYSNVDVTPSSESKAPSSKRPVVRIPSKVSSVPAQVSSPIKRTASSSSVKTSSPGPVSSPRRTSGDRSPASLDRRGSSPSRIPTSPASPSEGSEVGSDHDLVSSILSSSSEGEVR